MTRQNTLYRCFGEDDELLYVGITYDLNARIKEHRSTSSRWWPQVERIATERVSPFEIRQREREVILSEQPKHNIHHKTPQMEQRRITRLDTVAVMWCETHAHVAYPQGDDWYDCQCDYVLNDDCVICPLYYGKATS